LGGAVLVFHDLTRLRHLESVRQDFVANVSHEIKTPLSAIHGIVETMIDDPEMSSEMQEHFLLRMFEQSQRLGNLVRDLIALSRFESEDLPLDKEELDLRQPILDAYERFSISAQEKELTLSTDLPQHPVWVEGDGEALRQVFDNLLSNAVRYTPESGRITMRLKEERGQAWAEVEDSGIGIDQDHLSRIFERFYRVDTARSREQGGTGLGLSIVKHIATRLGGGVSVRSQPGTGTIFCVHLPLFRPGSSPSAQDSKP
jgi:two-component system phosphate regulon sensor histidine kinase PhoR